MAGAYYNEYDPGAAAWLRELIRRGLIADGEVDERSILDVAPDDLRGFTQCHFFAGIGGWSYALRLAGWPDDEPVWTGSPPCQPFSSAGRQKGKDDERHLAPHFAALVAAGRPPVLFGEQVASSAVFGKAPKRAQQDAGAEPEWAWIDDLFGRLEAARYACGAVDLPAAGVGAPHIRQRTFFGAVRLADASGQHVWRGLGAGDGAAGAAEGEARQREWGGHDHRLGSADDGMADASGIGPAPWVSAEAGGYEGKPDVSGDSGNRRAGPGAWQPGPSRLADADAWVSKQPERERARPDEAPGGRAFSEPSGQRDAGRLGDASGAAGEWDAGSVPAAQAGEHGARVAVDGRLPVGPEHAGAGVGGLADADGLGRGARTCWDVERQPGIGSQSGLGQGQDARRDGDQSGGREADWTAARQHPSTDHGGWADADWLFCRDGKWRPVEPGTFPLAHGLPARVVRLRGYGNAIVPQAAAQFIQAFSAAAQHLRLNPVSEITQDKDDIFG